MVVVTGKAVGGHPRLNGGPLYTSRAVAWPGTPERPRWESRIDCASRARVTFAISSPALSGLTRPAYAALALPRVGGRSTALPPPPELLLPPLRPAATNPCSQAASQLRTMDRRGRLSASTLRRAGAAVGEGRREGSRGVPARDQSGSIPLVRGRSPFFVHVSLNAAFLLRYLRSAPSHNRTCGQAEV